MRRYLYGAIALLFVASSTFFTRTTSAQSNPFIGQIGLFGYNFCPRGWVPADGQLLSINSHQSLFSLYGTIYGGDGRTTFALPDLRGRAPVHVGQGPGLSGYKQGQKVGVESVTLTTDQIPAHAHTLTGLTTPQGNTSGVGVRNGGGLQEPATTQTGGSEAHENRPPILVLRYCVAIEGVYPSRN